MNPTSFPFLPWLLLFLLGVLLSFLSNHFFIGFTVLLSLGLLFYYTFQPPWFKRSLIIGPCFFFLGFGLGKMDQMLPKQHYSKLVALEQKATIEFELEQRLRPTNLYDRYYIRLKKYNNTKTTGRLLLQVIKNTTETDLDYSKKWTATGKLKIIRAPLNPGQFDYKHYLKTIGIYHQFEIDSFPTAVKNQKANFFLQSKAFAIKRLKKSRLNTATKQLLNALLLGEKTALDREAIEAFSQAGLAHLLAISGLHIGLLMLLFRVLWFPVRFLKNGELFQSVGVVLSLWLYSLFVGIPQKKQGVWLAHRFGATVLIEHQNNQLRFYSNDTLTKEDFTVKHYQNYVGERSTEMLPLKNSYTINNAELVVVDGAWVESFKPVSVRYLLLRNNPKVNLERLLKKHSIKVVLIDGSNSPYYIARWKESLTHEKIAFHVTAEQGAYEFNLENEE